MPAAELNLTGDRRLTQGAKYEVNFRTRNAVQDQWVVSINGAGSDGDTFSAKLFSETTGDLVGFEAEASYVKQPGDSAIDVAIGLQTAIAGLGLVVPSPPAIRSTSIPSGTSAGDPWVVLADGGASFSLTTATINEYLALEVSSDGNPADISATNPQTVIRDISGADIRAKGRKHPKGDDMLFEWTIDNGLIILVDGFLGLYKILLWADTTGAYTWERAEWDLLEDYGSNDVIAMYYGLVECQLINTRA